MSNVDIGEYNKEFHEFDVAFADIMDEFSKAINTFKNNERFIRTRSLLAFSLMEVVCGIFNQYYDLRLENRALLKRWIKEYCLTDKNEGYTRNPYFKRIDEEYLYKFRNSIIHAFALPGPEGASAIMIPNGIETAENMQKLDQGFSRKGVTAIFISPDSLTGLVIKGAELLLQEMIVPDDKIDDIQFERIKRINAEFFRRGTKIVPLQ
jgi:hypothetical protein